MSRSGRPLPDSAEIPQRMTTLCTIGYQGATPEGFQRALQLAGVELLVDIRAVASSRRPGFSKSKLSAGVAAIGIDYLHLRALGTPADGRAAARGGRHAEMRAIFLRHMATREAREALEDLASIVRSGKRVCILCFETDPLHCHRNIVAAMLAELMPLDIVHLAPEADPLY